MTNWRHRIAETLEPHINLWFKAQCNMPEVAFYGYYHTGEPLTFCIASEPPGPDWELIDHQAIRVDQTIGQVTTRLLARLDALPVLPAA